MSDDSKKKKKSSDDDGDGDVPEFMKNAANQNGIDGGQRNRSESRTSSTKSEDFTDLPELTDASDSSDDDFDESSMDTCKTDDGGGGGSKSEDSAQYVSCESPKTEKSIEEPLKTTTTTAADRKPVICGIFGDVPTAGSQDDDFKKNMRKVFPQGQPAAENKSEGAKDDDFKKNLRKMFPQDQPPKNKAASGKADKKATTTAAAKSDTGASAKKSTDSDATAANSSKVVAESKPSSKNEIPEKVSDDKNPTSDQAAAAANIDDTKAESSDDSSTTKPPALKQKVTEENEFITVEWIGDKIRVRVVNNSESGDERRNLDDDKNGTTGDGKLSMVETPATTIEYESPATKPIEDSVQDKPMPSDSAPSPPDTKIGDSPASESIKSSASEPSTAPKTTKSAEPAASSAQQERRNELNLVLDAAAEHSANGDHARAVNRYKEVLETIDRSPKEPPILNAEEACALSFCLAIACLEYPIDLHLNLAEKEIGKFERFASNVPGLNHLVSYLRGKWHMKGNHYDEAKKEFENAEQLLKLDQNKTSELSYPGSSGDKTISITEEADFKKHLTHLLQICYNPPPADAFCRATQCNQRRREIYHTDSNFDGYYRLHCTSGCQIVFHTPCYLAYNRSFVDKDQARQCVTPECDGFFKCAKVYDKEMTIKTELTFKKGIEKAKEAKEMTKSAGRNAQKATKSDAQAAHRRDRSKSAARGGNAARNRVVSERTNEEDAGGRTRGQSEGTSRKLTGGGDEDEDERLVERPAVPLRRDDDGDQEQKLCKKKKQKKVKVGPTVVVFPGQFRRLPSTDRASDEEGEKQEQGHRHLTTGNENGAESVGEWENPTGFAMADLDADTKCAIDDLLCFLRNFIETQPEKRVSTTNEEFLYNFAKMSSNINTLVWDMGGWSPFLYHYGRQYSLTADDQNIYLVEVESDSEETHVSSSAQRAHREHQKELDRIRAEKQRKENLLLERQELTRKLNEAKRQEQEMKDSVSGKIQSLKEEIARAQNEIPAIQKSMHANQQKHLNDVKSLKAELEKAEETDKGLRRNTAELKEGIQKMEVEILHAKKMNHDYSERTKKGRQCKCEELSKESETRIRLAHTAALSLQHQVAMIDLDARIRRGRERMGKIDERLESPQLQGDERAAYFEHKNAWGVYLRTILEHVESVKHQFDQLTHKVRAGGLGDDQPVIDIPEAPIEPRLEWETEREESLPRPPSSTQSNRSSSLAGSTDMAAENQYAQGEGRNSTTTSLLNQSFISSTEFAEPEDRPKSTSSFNSGGDAALARETEEDGFWAQQQPQPQPQPFVQAVAEGPQIVASNSIPTASVTTAGQRSNSEKLVEAVQKKFPNMDRNRILAAIRDYRRRVGNFNGINGRQLFDDVCAYLANGQFPEN